MEFPQFFIEGSEWKPGDTTKMCILSYILYIYFEINVFKAQMVYGGTQKCKNKMISEGF